MDATVVIPTFNRKDDLLKTLEALRLIDYPGDLWEAVIVDDGSTDGTEEVVERWIAETKATVRYFKQRNAGPAAARNRGAAMARGEALIFIDNDIIAPPDFVRAHLETLRANPGSWVLGRIVHPPELRGTPFGRYRDDCWESFHRSYPVEGVSLTDGMSAANVSMPAADFHRLGGFDECFTIASSEDWDLGMRARRAGVKIIYNPAIVAVHNDWAVTLEKFCERQRLYSVSDVLLWQKYGDDSPRAALIRENTPIDWLRDSLKLVCKKALKVALATGVGKRLINAACRVTERLAPDSRLNRRAYDTAVGVAIFSGVREGWRQYGGAKADNRRRLVCHLIDNNIDTAYFRSIARRHDKTRFPVMIGSIAPAGPLQSAMESLDTPTFSLDVTSRWQYPLAVWRLARLIKQRDVSILHAHCFDPTFVGLLAARLAKVPFVFTRHHSDHNIRINKKWHTMIDSWCARKADHVIAVSRATRDIMIEIERVPPKQITVVYNGMEPLRAAEPERIERLRRELGLRGEPVIVMVARLHEEKGHRFLFDALPKVVAQVGEVTVLLAGGGPHRAEIEAEAAARGVSRWVRFLGRIEEVPELLTLASVIVLPSLAESFGFAALEAMSAGKPVVAAATGGIPEVVADEESGLLVPRADGEALARAIIRILSAPNLAEKLGEAGKGLVTRFTFEKMIKGYEQVYARSISKLSFWRSGEFD